MCEVGWVEYRQGVEVVEVRTSHCHGFTTGSKKLEDVPTATQRSIIPNASAGNCLCAVIVHLH